jgi:hypothetical protein
MIITNDDSAANTHFAAAVHQHRPIEAKFESTDLYPANGIDFGT